MLQNYYYHLMQNDCRLKAKMSAKDRQEWSVSIAEQERVKRVVTASKNVRVLQVIFNVSLMQH